MTTRSSPWTRPRVVLLVGIVVVFIVFSTPPYLTLDAERSRVPVPDLPGYYPLLVVHVVFASLAMATACVQLISSAGARHRQAHRLSGYLYVFAGVLPAGLSGLVIGARSPFGPTIAVSNVFLALLWLTSSFTGLWMARARRHVEHRRWMVRSIVLTMSVITNRLIAVIVYLAFSPRLHTTFGGDETRMLQTVAGVTGWVGWVLPLLIAEWWFLEREHRRRARKSAHPGDEGPSEPLPSGASRRNDGADEERHG